MANPASPLTGEGTILGTLNYMSPEQIEGKEADARSDIFALGAVLYEMASGKRAFEGKSQISVASAILEKDPASILSIQPLTPASLDRLISACLAKNADDRLQSARDVELELKWIRESPAMTPATATHGSQRLWVLITALATIAATVALAGWWRATRPEDHPLIRLNVDLGPEALSGLDMTVAISPDGRRIVFPARGAQGQVLATRLLNQPQITLLPGTENGSDPFFSPDGQWVGFTAINQLKKVSVQGGTPVTLDEAPTRIHGASWGKGNIVAEFGSALPLSQIPDAGGPRRVLTKLAPTEISHRWPQILPGGAAVIFTASSSVSSMQNANIEVVSLETGNIKTLLQGGYCARYLPSGHLVYVHQGVLYAVKFDPDRLVIQGSPVPVLEDVAADAANGGGQFDFSNTGTFVYLAGQSTGQAWQISWLDASGKMQPLLSELEAYALPRFSPKGRKLAFAKGADIYVHDVERDTTMRVTFNGRSAAPIWSPDERHLAFASDNNILWMRSDGSGEPQELLKTESVVRPWSFSPDGKWLLYFDISPETGFDIFLLPLDLTDPEHPKPGKPEVFQRTPAAELLPRFSPDGRWIAYRAGDSGGGQIYVRPFPAAKEGKWQISTDGGLYAMWSSNGHELFYETPDNHIMVVDYIVEGDSFVAGKPRLWLDKQLFFTGTSNLDLAPDGKRFAVLSMPEKKAGTQGSVHVTMLLNFFDELKRRIP